MLTARQKNIIIAGAGFGGIRCALDLHKHLKKYHLFDQYKIILIDKNRMHLYSPNLYETASIVTKDCCNPDLMNASVAIDINDIIAASSIHFINDHILNIDTQNKIVKTRTQNLSYEYLIMALGSETNYFNIPGAQEHSFPLKTLTDAIELRKQIDMFLVSPDIKRFNIVIGGGGLTGVELSGELAHALKKLKKLYGCDIHTTITIIEVNPTILNGMPEKIIKAAQRRLKKHKIRIETDTKIKSVESARLIIENKNTTQSIDYSIFIWTGGVKPNSLLIPTLLKKNPKGCAVVNEYLQINNDVWAIGDVAFCENPNTPKPLPGTAYIAIKEGKIAAKNILAKIRNKKPMVFAPSGSYSFIIPIGGKFAIAYFKGVVIKGYLGWIIKLLVELKYLLSILTLHKAIIKWIQTIRIVIKND